MSNKKFSSKFKLYFKLKVCKIEKMWNFKWDRIKQDKYPQGAKLHTKKCSTKYAFMELNKVPCLLLYQL